MGKQTRPASGYHEEIVIAVMGPTGVGKSTFINMLLGVPQMAVGNTLASCTREISIAKIDYRGRHLVLVDTPGFDDSHLDDLNILRCIAGWLKTAYEKDAVLGGIIYLHDISASRFTGTARRNLLIFNNLCGEAALNKVILGTTHWGNIDRRIGEGRVKELKEIYWQEMLAHGAIVHKVERGDMSAFKLIDSMLRNEATRLANKKVLPQDCHSHQDSLRIQKEMVVEKKRIPETKAGQELRYTLQQVLDLQKGLMECEAQVDGGEDGPEVWAKLEKKQRELDALADQIHALKFSIPRRIRHFFRF